MEASSSTSTDPPPTPGSTSTEGPDIAFPMPSRAVMLLVRPRQPKQPTDRSFTSVSKTQTTTNARPTMSRSMSLNVPNDGFKRPRRTLSASRAPGQFPQRAYGPGFPAPSGRQSSSRRGRSHSPSEEPDNQKAMNALLAAHNLELVASRSPTPSATSLRSSPRLYVKPPMQVPEESDAELPVRIQPRSQVLEEPSSSNPMDTTSSSPRPPSLSSFSLGSPTPSPPNISPDTNETPAYTILGTLDPATHENTIAPANPDQNSDQGLRIMKIMSKRWSRQLAAERELNVLKWLSEISEDEYQRAENQMTGFNFLQKMSTSFQNSELTFIVLEHHPAPLTHPDIVTRLRIRQSNHPAGSRSSIVPAVTLSPIQSIPARLRALRLLAAELVLGLLFLHENGIVHQDITPANVMISATGHAIIGEFGAARRLPVIFRETSPTGSPSSNSRSSAQQYGPIVRKATESSVFMSLYAAPEAIEANDDGMLVYDEAIDFWSLGVLLYEIAMGSLPFDNAEGEGSKVGDMVNNKGSHVLFEIFVRELLIRDPHARLRGSIVKDHIFFQPLSGIWGDIALLKHPPVPNPLLNQMKSQPSFFGNRSFMQRKLTLPNRALPSSRDQVVVPKSILRRPTLQNSDNPLNLGDIRKPATIPEEAVPPENNTGVDEAVCSDCIENIQFEETNSSPSAASDSGLVIPDDVPPSFDNESKSRSLSHSEYDSPKSSLSSPILTPNLDGRPPRPSDVDEELLAAAQTCFHLEEYLSAGIYFNDPNENVDFHLPQEPMQSPVSFAAVRSRPSSEVSDDLSQHYETQKQSFIEVTPREPPRQTSVVDDAGDWRFENEITMAVLDAMDRQSRSPNRDEFGVMGRPSAQTTPNLTRSRRTSPSIRRTFEKFRRRIGSP